MEENKQHKTALPEPEAINDAEALAALLDIPYGGTISYGELARRVDNPRGVRAVGQANHHNPIPILIPCHRVVGADGSLTGYGGGVELKRALLALEKRA